jgi:hypothetical protein
MAAALVGALGGSAWAGHSLQGEACVSQKSECVGNKQTRRNSCSSIRPGARRRRRRQSAECVSVAPRLPTANARGNEASTQKLRRNANDCRNAAEAEATEAQRSSSAVAAATTSTAAACSPPPLSLTIAASQLSLFLSPICPSWFAFLRREQAAQTHRRMWPGRPQPKHTPGALRARGARAGGPAPSTGAEVQSRAAERGDRRQHPGQRKEGREDDAPR